MLWVSQFYRGVENRKNEIVRNLVALLCRKWCYRLLLRLVGIGTQEQDALVTTMRLIKRSDTDVYKEIVMCNNNNVIDATKAVVREGLNPTGTAMLFCNIIGCLCRSGCIESPVRNLALAANAIVARLNKVVVARPRNNNTKTDGGPLAQLIQLLMVQTHQATSASRAVQQRLHRNPPHLIKTLVTSLLNPMPIGGFEGLFNEYRQLMALEQNKNPNGSAQSKRLDRRHIQRFSVSCFIDLYWMYAIYCSYGRIIDLSSWFYHFCRLQLRSSNEGVSGRQSPMGTWKGLPSASSIRTSVLQRSTDVTEGAAAENIFEGPQKCSCLRCLRRKFQNAVETFVILGLINEPRKRMGKTDVQTEEENAGDYCRARYSEESDHQQNLVDVSSLNKQKEQLRQIRKFCELEEAKVFSKIYCRRILFSNWSPFESTKDRVAL